MRIVTIAECELAEAVLWKFLSTIHARHAQMRETVPPTPAEVAEAESTLAAVIAPQMRGLFG